MYASNATETIPLNRSISGGTFMFLKLRLSTSSSSSKSTVECCRRCLLACMEVDSKTNPNNNHVNMRRAPLRLWKENTAAKKNLILLRGERVAEVQYKVTLHLEGVYESFLQCSHVKVVLRTLELLDELLPRLNAKLFRNKLVHAPPRWEYSAKHLCIEMEIYLR